MAFTVTFHNLKFIIFSPVFSDHIFITYFFFSFALCLSIAGGALIDEIDFVNK